MPAAYSSVLKEWSLRPSFIDAFKPIGFRYLLSIRNHSDNYLLNLVKSAAFLKFDPIRINFFKKFKKCTTKISQNLLNRVIYFDWRNILE